MSNTETNKPQPNKTLWMIILLSGITLMVVSFIFLISNILNPQKSNIAAPEHQELMSIINNSIEEAKSSGITETTIEEYKDKNGDEGTVNIYKYYNAETQKGVSCINSCETSLQKEDINGKVSWLKIFNLDNSHTQTLIKKINENTYEVKYLNSNPNTETWVTKDGLVTEIKGTSKNNEITTIWDTQINYSVQGEGTSVTK